MHSPRLMLMVAGATALAGMMACEEAFNVIEEPVPTEPINNVTPSPTPWLKGHLTLNPERVDFGPIAIGCRGLAEVSVRNDGQEPVRVFGVAASQNTSSEFLLDDYVTSLDPFETLVIPVAYSPVNPGLDEGFMLLQTDDTSDGSEVKSVVLSGRDSQLGERIESFLQPPGTPADFIWLLDTSGSMSNDIDKIIANFDRFLEELEDLNISYHMALLTSSLDDNGEFQGTFGAESVHWVTSEMGSQGLTDFLDVMYLKSREVRQTDERAIDSLYKALSPELLADRHNGFLREGARLVVTAFSDEDDHSTITPPQMGQRLLETAKGGEVVFSSIIGIGDPTNDCHDEEGDVYRQLSLQFNGYIDDVCNASYAGLMGTLGSYGAAAESIFALTGDPELAYGFVVKVEDAVIDPAASAEATTGWVYDSASNAIVFRPASVPPAGSRVDILYTQIASCN